MRVTPYKMHSSSVGGTGKRFLKSKISRLGFFASR